MATAAEVAVVVAVVEAVAIFKAVKMARHSFWRGAESEVWLARALNL